MNPGPAPTQLSVSQRPSALKIGLSRVGLEIRQFSRIRDQMIFTFSFPVILLFIFGSVFSDDIAPGVSFTQYFAAGMIASGIALSSFQSLAITIAVERDEGTLKRLYGTPMPAASYFIGKVGLVLASSVLQTAILLGVAAVAFGLKLPDSLELWGRFLGIFVLGSAAGTVCGIAFSSVPRSAKSSAAVVSPVILVLQFVSGVFFVYSDLPSWMQTFGAIFPLKWLAQGMRSVFLPADFATAEVGGSWQLGWTVVILVVWIVIGLVLCLRTFRWLPRV